MIKIHFVGDIFPGGVIIEQEVICSDHVKSFIEESDIRVATLESAIGEGYPFDPDKMNNPDWRNIIYAPDRSLKHLKKLGIDVVTLANNHIFDLGEKGVINTIKQLDVLGIKHCGAGRNLYEASKPAIVEVKGKTIAFIGAMVESWGAAHPANNEKGGINPLNVSRIMKDIVSLKQHYDYVFILIHWGIEYTYWPVAGDIQNAKILIDAGADGIFASHTHQVQPLITYKNKPIGCSLGNFIFPDFYMKSNRPIWYPTDNDDLINIQRTNQYPKESSTNLLRVWPHKNRIGMIAQVSITDNSIKSNYSYVFLDSNNVLQPYKSTALSLRLSMIGWLGNNEMFRPIYIVKQYGVRKLFARLISKLK